MQGEKELLWSLECVDTRELHNRLKFLKGTKASNMVNFLTTGQKTI